MVLFKVNWQHLSGEVNCQCFIGGTLITFPMLPTKIRLNMFKLLFGYCPYNYTSIAN